MMSKEKIAILTQLPLVGGWMMGDAGVLFPSLHAQGWQVSESIESSSIRLRQFSLFCNTCVLKQNKTKQNKTQQQRRCSKG
jgi:hypothetical protein